MISEELNWVFAWAIDWWLQLLVYLEYKVQNSEGVPFLWIVSEVLLTLLLQPNSQMKMKT
jgi:hypothetical protein